jgi:hypothetical protein
MGWDLTSTQKTSSNVFFYGGKCALLDRNAKGEGIAAVSHAFL